MPRFLEKIANKLPADGQAKLRELHTMYSFSEEQVEAFELNNSAGITMNSLQDFGKVLEQDSAKRSTKPVAPTPARSSVGGPGSKRKQPGMALPGGVGAALGRVAAPASQAVPESTTPVPKRAREAEGDRISPPKEDSPTKTVAVSVKSSVNEHLMKPAGSASAAAQVRVLGDESLWKGPKGGAYRWMDEAIEDRAAAHHAQLAAMEGQILEAVRARPAARLSVSEGEDEVQTGIVGVSSQAEVALCGRLLCEGLEGRLNERSILLEGSRASARGARVNLNLNSCPHVAAFPGQIVGVLGRSSGQTGSTFHARDFVTGLPPSLSLTPRADAQLHLMVAAGPFCLRDNLDYTPLENAIAHAARVRPRVLLLLGPLLDAGNLKVSSGETVIPGDTEPLAYEEVYSKYLLPMLARCLAPLRRGSPATEVLILPSLEEALCFHPLPQPPLDDSLSIEPPAFNGLRNLGVKFLPNPAHLEINGLRVSATSADALSPVVRELVLRPAAPKIEEALRLLLGQRTLFPVLPRDPAQVSETRAEALSFPGGATPDLCIFPSVVGVPTGTFVDGCAFVNPGQLCRGVLGTFAEVNVLPDAKGAAPGAAPLTIGQRARVDILKLG